ncbi:MAG: hypothetical protein JSU87_11155 [Gemmatimonadota bacterium]|nr:MAG: hypothetical protein JSU87_11155 [Gemmatimonadota bacterium]
MSFKLVGLSLATALAVTSVACERQAPARQLIIGEPSDVGLIFPLAHRNYDLDSELRRLLYPGLNSARWENGRVEYSVDDMSLARAWEFDADSTAITYVLRSDAVWSDGEAIDGQDVVFTYNLMRRLGSDFPYGDYYRAIDSVVAREPRRVTFFFSRRYPQMLEHSGYSIVPEHVYRDYEPTIEALARHPALREPGDSLVVSGPYLVTEWLPGERLALRANPRFAGEVKIENVVIRFVPEATTRVVELENGSLDVVNPVPPELLPRLAEAQRFRLASRGARFYDFIAWNGARFEPFADPVIRRALSLAIDRQGILDGLQVADFAVPAAGPWPPIFAQAAAESLEPDPYLPDTARAIFASRGWRDTDDDGILDRNGRPFRFTLVTSPGSGLLRSSAAEIIQAHLARVGIDVELRLLERSALNDLVYFDRTRQFQAALVGWSSSLDGTHVRDQFWPPDAQYNVTGYISAALDTLIPQALASTTRDQAARYWSEAAKVIATDRPLAFLWFYGEAVALTNRVRNTKIDTYSVYQNLHQWTLQP